MSVSVASGHAQLESQENYWESTEPQSTLASGLNASLWKQVSADSAVTAGEEELSTLFEVGGSKQPQLEKDSF